MALHPVHVVVAHTLLLDPERGSHYIPEIAALPEQERLVAMARFDAASPELLETIADSSDVLLVSLVEPVLTEDGEDPSEAEVRAALGVFEYLAQIIDLDRDIDREEVVRRSLRAARRVRIELLTEQTATLQRVRRLAEKWQDTSQVGPDRSSTIINAFGATLQDVLDGKSP